jgi:hypothetical protein
MGSNWKNLVGQNDKVKNPWHNPGFTLGEVAEWLMAADCKSALLRVRWFESSPLHQVMSLTVFG